MEALKEDKNRHSLYFIMQELLKIEVLYCIKGCRLLRQKDFLHTHRIRVSPAICCRGSQCHLSGHPKIIQPVALGQEEKGDPAWSGARVTTTFVEDMGVTTK